MFLTSLIFAQTFPLSTNGRYLKDANNVPFFLNGEAAFSLIAQLTYDSANYYLTDRASRGFNGILVTLIEHKFANLAPKNRDNVAPFTGANFTTPNEAYFAHADSVINRANALGMVVFLMPIYLGYNCTDEGWCVEVQNASSADMISWGQYVGNRYKSYKNIIWVMGADQNPVTYSTKAKVDTMVYGMKLSDTLSARLYTTHSERETQATTHWTNRWVTLNSVYPSFATSVTLSQSAYDASPTLPYFYLEGYYENEHTMTAQELRAQAYWTVLNGSFGHIFGNCPMWGLGSSTMLSFCDASATWQSQLSSVGTVSMTRFDSLFTSRHWYNLVPDRSASVITAGANATTDIATFAYASDSTTIMGYLPTSRAVTINPAKVNGDSTTWKWYNPNTGTWTTIGTYNHASRAVTPSAGDWVLVIDAYNIPRKYLLWKH